MKYGFQVSGKEPVFVTGVKGDDAMVARDRARDAVTDGESVRVFSVSDFGAECTMEIITQPRITSDLSQIMN